MRRRLVRLDSSRLARLGVGVVCAGALALYLTVGQPGFHGDRLFVVLAEQADLTAAQQLTEHGERRATVYRTLVAHAEATQRRLRRALDRVGVRYTPYYLVNALEVRAGPLVQLWLEAQPEIDRVLHDPVLRPLPAPAW